MAVGYMRGREGGRGTFSTYAIHFAERAKIQKFGLFLPFFLVKM